MLDINFIRQNPEEVKKICQAKNIDLDVDKILALDNKRRELISRTDELRAEQKKIKKEEREKGKEIKEKLKPLLKELALVEEEYNTLMLLTPNNFSEDTPIGPDESYNKEIYRWGKPRKFDFKIKDHIQLGKELDLIDLEKGVKTAGFRGYYLKNEAALLHFALIWHAVWKMVEKGFTPMVPPTILKEFALIGSGYFPFDKKEVYRLVTNSEKGMNLEEEKTSFFLGGTSEPAILAYFSDKILKEEDLPIKVFGFSQCYRSEAGSYGKDTKGLYRLHEFMKVEQVVICKNDIKESNKWMEEMRKIVQEILEELELPYRVLQISTGDMGAGKYRMYDIETWMPSRNSYGETHSDSNLTDWQARRLNIKYKAKKDGHKYFVHTLNNTVLASPRILIAVLENYQRKDGKIDVPKILQKYLGFKTIPRNKNK